MVYAVDLVRLADGSWRVVHDLTDAPMGLGDALLHRAVIARVLHDAHRLYGAARLTDHLTHLRAALAALAPSDRGGGRVVMLSGGLHHPGYFEQSYLARTLGYHVVEGADLIARDHRVWLRSLSGPEPIDVVLRGIEGSSTDPAATFHPATGPAGSTTTGVAGVLDRLPAQRGRHRQPGRRWSWRVARVAALPRRLRPAPARPSAAAARPDVALVR